METPRTGWDTSLTSSRSSSIPTKLKNCFKRFFNGPGADREETWDSQIIALRPKNSCGILAPDRRQVTRPSEQEYDTNHRFRGKVYIFNHLKFKKAPSRVGTMRDVDSLRKALPKLGFRPEDIICLQDLTLDEVEEQLGEISREDHTDSDMLVVFILTHGQRDGKIYAHDRDYPIQEVWDHFTADKCETLKGKPKIFFIIACRGNNMDDGAVILQPRKTSVTEIDAVRCQTSVTCRIPIWADFLTIYSTMEGYYSYRHPNEGTWYIQAFCNELNNYPEPYMHFTDFLTKVSQNVSHSYQTMFDDPQLNKKKQCPFITSSLRKVINLEIASNQSKANEEVKRRPKSMIT